MVIILKAWKITSEGHAFYPKVLYKWKKGTEFPFDVDDPEQWRDFLSNLTIGGSPLPRKSKYGHIIHYQVYNFGGKYVNYFPGVREGSHKKIAKWGYLK